MLSTELDPEWCAWFTGFFEGEGCLDITKAGTPRARIKVRNDDKPVLDEIQSILGGKVYAHSYQFARNGGVKSRDQVSWEVTSIQNVPLVISALDLGETGTFDSWFAGFFDAEGCFQIDQTGCPRVTINLRQDDVAVLREIATHHGGSVRIFSSEGQRKSRKIKSQDIACWNLIGYRNCEHTVMSLEGKMRSKKAKDFEVFKRAVLHSLSINDGKPDKTLERRRIMLEYRDELKTLRDAGKYIESSATA